MQVIDVYACSHLQGCHILWIGEGTWETVIENIHSRERIFLEVGT